MAAVAIQSATAFVTLVKSIRGAEAELKALSRGVHDFYAVALSLRTVLMDAEMQTAISRDGAIVGVIETLASPLKSCQNLMTEVMIKIHKQCRLRGENKTRRVKATNVIWGLSIKGDMKELREHLEAAKLTLCTALSAVNLYVRITILSIQHSTNRSQVVQRTVADKERHSRGHHQLHASNE